MRRTAVGRRWPWPRPSAATAARADDAKETLPPGAKLVKIEAQPADITLDNPFEYAQLVLTGVLDTGERLDVTRMADVEKPANVKVSPTGAGAADGRRRRRPQVQPRRPDGDDPRQGDGPERQIRGQLRPRRDADDVAHGLQRRHLPRRARTARTASSCRCAATTRILDHRVADRRPGGPPLQPRRPRHQPDAAQAVRRRAARRRRPHPAGRAVLRIAPLVDRPRRQARPRTARASPSSRSSRKAPSSRCRA